MRRGKGQDDQGQETQSIQSPGRIYDIMKWSDTIKVKRVKGGEEVRFDL